MGKTKDLFMQVREREGDDIVFEDIVISHSSLEMEFNLKQSKSNQMESKLQEVKNELSAYTGIRDVETWNQIRNAFKLLYPISVINELDGSGYIVEWLKG
jgi:hypothetical protein